MNTLTVALFACLVVLASAKPSGIWGHGLAHAHGGPVTIVGASGVVGPNGAAGPTGVVTGHGAVGPNGIPNAIGHVGVLGAGIGGIGIGGIGIGGIGIGGHGIGAAWDGEDNGQWHGEGLLASQDLAGHGLGLGLGLGHGAHW